MRSAWQRERRDRWAPGHGPGNRWRVRLALFALWCSGAAVGVAVAVVVLR